MVHEKVISKRKLDYRAKVENFLQTYQNALIVNVDMVGSKQLQGIRLALRGKAEVLLGKNTILRKVIREAGANNKRLLALLPTLRGNVGLVFTNGSLSEIRKIMINNKVPAAAKVGALAPTDVFIPPGPTGLDPGQTNFFQALNIATKIVKGTIEIINQVHLIKAGEKVSPSHVSLLQKLDIKPFFYSAQVLSVFEGSSVYDASILDMTDDDLMAKFLSGVRTLTALSLGAGYPTISTIPHSIGRAFKNLLALAVVSDFSFKEADLYKEYLANPEEYAKKHGLSLGGGGGGGGGGSKAAAEEKKEDKPKQKEEPKKEEEEEEYGGMDLFGGGD